jgi:hypothetical protein
MTRILRFAPNVGFRLLCQRLKVDLYSGQHGWSAGNYDEFESYSSVH